MEQGLSVRQTEALVRKIIDGSDTRKRSAAPMSKDRDTLRLEQRLSDTIGAPVSIKHTPQGKGELTIRYSSLDELEGVLKHLGLNES